MHLDTWGKLGLRRNHEVQKRRSRVEKGAWMQGEEQSGEGSWIKGEEQGSDGNLDIGG